MALAQKTGEAINRASVMRFKERDALVLVEERTHDYPRALVLISILDGLWTSCETEPYPCEARNSSRLLDYPIVRRGVGDIARGLCGERYDDFGHMAKHPIRGVMQCYKSFDESPGINVLAEGWCKIRGSKASSEALQRLLLMDPGARFRISRGGKVSKEAFFEWDGKTLSVWQKGGIFPVHPEDEDEGEII